MPEGPSIVILTEQVQQFEGQTVLAVSGNSKIGIDRLLGQTVQSFQSWGKHFLICFTGFTVKIHLLLFGSYRINEHKDTAPRLSLTFDNGTLDFYACSVQFLEGDLNTYYDWSADVMNPQWNPSKALEKIRMMPHAMVCDLLLEQDIFSGVGNIIKNEILYLSYIHPESVCGKIPENKLRELIDDAVAYSFNFLKWKKAFTLKAHWLAHTKKTCHRCALPLLKKQTGAKKRGSFFCENCQKLYR